MRAGLSGSRILKRAVNNGGYRSAYFAEPHWGCDRATVSAMRSNPTLARAYGRQLVRAVIRGYPLRPCDAARSLPAWWTSTRDESRTPLGDRQPWITFAALRHLEPRIVPGCRVFEYGVGGSSAFFLDQGARLVSVDHDPDWAAKARAACSGDWELHTIPPGAAEHGYRSHVVCGSFREYATVIDRYSDFEVVMVDGRARSDCLRHARAHVAPGGLLVLDNSERDRYADAASELDRLGWERKDFYGPGPYNVYFWQTTIWSPARTIRAP